MSAAPCHAMPAVQGLHWAQPDPKALQAIARSATLALYEELALSPKPGLVTLIDSGSHRDMDAGSFMRSLFSLRGYFVRITGLGAAHAPFEVLEQAGIAAESRMLAATGGINTHRGAVFCLGLLCAAAGAVLAQGQALEPACLRRTLLSLWGQALAEKACRKTSLPGGRAASRYGLRGAAAEAALGFPVLFECALPALQASLASGLARQYALLDTLFRVMAVLDDCNLVHRGGLAGLRYAQACAQGFLAEGGSARPGGLIAAQTIAQNFVARRLSPGGAADTLAASCLIYRLGVLGRLTQR